MARVVETLEEYVDERFQIAELTLTDDDLKGIAEIGGTGTIIKNLSGNRQVFYYSITAFMVLLSASVSPVAAFAVFCMVPLPDTVPVKDRLFDFPGPSFTFQRMTPSARTAFLSDRVDSVRAKPSGTVSMTVSSISLVPGFETRMF